MLKTALLVFLLSYVDGQFIPGYGYHMTIGIPKAESMMRSELGIGRIVGGNKVPDSMVIPHHAGIVVTLTTGWTSICGGAVISKTRVLTAAHCWFDGRSQAKEFTIVLGSVTVFTGGTRIKTSDVVVYPAWNPADITYDIAVVRIRGVDFNNNIQSIPLPSVADVNQNFAGMTATASGFGKTSDAQTSFPTTTALHYINLKVMSNAECQKSFEVPIHVSHLCTSGQGKVGTCDGDSGGPLTVVWKQRRMLVGIVSFGLGNACQAGYPSVYSRVTAFLTWIQAQL
ncbi:brachyurin-like [Epargyreus clarus]|uniref:brachyurin-like n=1 Tax=Epargyreus clarus TaxID=520877 RepID=UPI003C2CB314